MNSRILITGGFGYIGGRIVKHLRGERVALRLSTRRSSDSFPEWSAGLDIVRANMASEDDLASLCLGVDTIIHLAAMNEHACAADPVAAVRVNSEASVLLLEVAKSAGVKRYIYFSTAHVYGAPLEGKITEQNLPKPRHPYAITHRIVEDFVLAEQNQGEMAGLVLRLSNGMGAPADTMVDRWSLISNDLCRQAVEKGVLTLKSSGLQKRDFIPLSDVSRAVSHFLDMDSVKWADGLFNLGGECPMSIFRMAEMIAQRAEVVLGIKVNIQRPKCSLIEESPYLDYRIDKLKETGFSLAGSVRDEIDATLKLCQELIG